MPSTIKSESIILKKKRLLQKDLQITLFTKEKGKMKAIAKGVKSITSRRSPHLETGNLVNVVISQSETGSYIQQTDLISGFVSIKNDPQKLDYMYTFFFIVDRILPEEQIEESMYILVKSFLIELGKQKDFGSSYFQKYLYNLLYHLGYIHQERPVDELIKLTEEIINEKVPINVIM